MLRSTLLAAFLTFMAQIPSAPLPAQSPTGAEPPAPDATGLTLDALLDAVAQRNPRLRAMTASAAAAGARVAEASTLPDPVLQFGVMNVGLPNLNADMPSSMAPSIQLMQMVPFPGKLGLRGDIADASLRMADAGSAEAWWEERGRAADLFYTLYSLDRRVEVSRSTLTLLEDFRTIARAMYTAGSGRQADVLRADVEVARMDGEIRKMEAMRTAAAARLNGLIDRPSTTAVPSPVLGALPASVPAPDTLRRWAWESRPLLDRGRVAVERADRGIELAHRLIWPDLTLGVTYGQSNRGTGTERMGSALIGFSLPIHASSRQYAAREEATAVKRMAEAELGAVRADVDATIGVLLADLEIARTLIDLYRGEVLPEARATVESALSSYRVGAVDFMTLVDAEMTVNRYETELHTLLADYGRALAGLESSIGRPLPQTSETLVVSREER